KTDSKAKVAVVNGVVITEGALNQELGRFEQQFAMGGQKPDAAQMAEMKKSVLDGLVAREVLKQEAEKQGLKADPAEVDSQIANVKKRFPNEDDFKALLTKMNITEADLKAQVGQELIITKLIDQQVASKITITDEETKAFYDKNPDMFKTPEMVRASHILVKVDANASAEDKAKAHDKIAEIQKKIKDGGDFAALAQESSDCPSKAKGGDLNFFRRGQMVPAFEQAAFGMKVGDVSDIVETQFGYHLIKLTDKKDAGTMSYVEIKEKIANHLKQEKTGEQVEQYIAKLKADAKIETFLK
ncbi:MAG: peptidylprolyl isomerase, partial [Acidobacteriota bacterium]